MGLSIRNSARNIENRYGIPRPSTATIHNELKDHVEDAAYATRDVKAHTGNHWVADEMVIDVDGENVYHWNVMDRDTRFLLASYVSKSRGADAAVETFKRALARADHPPRTIRTDKWVAYPPALQELMPNTKHEPSQGISHWINNNLSERMQGTYRNRVKTARGFGNVSSAQQFLDAFNLTYNYFRDHSQLQGRTPAQAARVEIPFKEWADVVRANIEVPEDWRRKRQPKVIRQKQHAGHTRKGYRKRPKKGPEVAPRVQLGFYRKKKPSPKDRRQAAEFAAKAPKAVMPNVQFGGQHTDEQLRMIPKHPAGIPKRMRPRPVCSRRR